MHVPVFFQEFASSRPALSKPLSLALRGGFHVAVYRTRDGRCITASTRRIYREGKTGRQSAIWQEYDRRKNPEIPAPGCDRSESTCQRNRGDKTNRWICCGIYCEAVILDPSLVSITRPYSVRVAPYGEDLKGSWSRIV